MRIYTDKLSRADVTEAFEKARQSGQDIRIDEMNAWIPRNPREPHKARIDVWAYASNGKRASGRDPYQKAPTWDAWGYVISYLFNVDPDARIGHYHGEADFVNLVTRYPGKGSHLQFLDVLDNIAHLERKPTI